MPNTSGTVPFILHSVILGAPITSEHETLFDAVRTAHRQDERGTASPGYITLTDPRTGEKKRWNKDWINNCELEHLCGTCQSVKLRVHSTLVSDRYGDRIERICSDCDLTLRRALIAADAEGLDMVRQESADGVVTIRILPHDAGELNVKHELFEIFIHLIKPVDDDNPSVTTATDEHISMTTWEWVLQTLEQHEIDVLHMWKPAQLPDD